MKSSHFSLMVALSALALTACGPQRLTSAGADGQPSVSPSVRSTNTPNGTTSTSASPTGTPSPATPSPDTSTPTPSTPAPSTSGGPALTAAEKRWATKAPSSYSYTYSPRCFCPPDPYLVSVRDGVVVSVAAVGATKSGTYKPSLADAPTIASLFQQLQTAYRGGGSGEFGGPAAKVTVSYDDKFGFPSAAFIDWSANAIDEESGYTVTGFAPLAS